MSPEWLARLSLYAYFAAACVVAATLLLGWLAVAGVGAAAGRAGRGTRLPARAAGVVLPWGVRLALACLSASVLARAIVAGRPPWANQYEFAVAFAWACLAAYLALARRAEARPMAPGVLALALGLLLYASTLPSAVTPPVPALQSPLLLGLHVGCALVAYAANAVAFVAALLFLVQLWLRWRRGRVSRRLPAPRTLDEVGYGAVMVGFPLLGATLLLGSWWSSIAWGSYWSWDPKQTSTLATWLVYAVYLHTRVLRERQNVASAALLVLGFALTLLTYAGNLFFGGLHSYSGV